MQRKSSKQPPEITTKTRYNFLLLVVPLTFFIDEKFPKRITPQDEKTREEVRIQLMSGLRKIEVCEAGQSQKSFRLPLTLTSQVWCFH